MRPVGLGGEHAMRSAQGAHGFREINVRRIELRAVDRALGERVHQLVEVVGKRPAHGVEEAACLVRELQALFHRLPRDGPQIVDRRNRGDPLARSHLRGLNLRPGGGVEHFPSERNARNEGDDHQNGPQDMHTVTPAGSERDPAAFLVAADAARKAKLLQL